jgi:hypothetical protein
MDTRGTDRSARRTTRTRGGVLRLNPQFPCATLLAFLIDGVPRLRGRQSLERPLKSREEPQTRGLWLTGMATTTKQSAGVRRKRPMLVR